MRLKLTVLILALAAVYAGRLFAQALKFDTPYTCAGGITIVVDGCEKRGRLVVCTFRTFKNGQDLGGSYGPQDPLLKRLQACTEQRTTEQPAAPGTTGRGGRSNAAASPADQKSSNAKVEAEVVAPAAALEHMFISPRGAHLATAVQRGSRWVVTHDGVDGPRFDEIVTNRVRFSPDGARYAYFARSGEEYVFMVDGKELTRIPRTNTRLDLVADAGPADFSSNGKQVYFAIRRTGTGRNEENYCQLYVNGQPVQKSYSGSDPCKPTWSPDGNRYALIVNPVHTPVPRTQEVRSC